MTAKKIILTPDAVVNSQILMENPLKDCLTIQVSEEDVNSPDFDLSNYMNKKIKDAWFKKALESEQTQYHFPFNNVTKL